MVSYAKHRRSFGSRGNTHEERIHLLETTLYQLLAALDRDDEAASVVNLETVRLEFSQALNKSRRARGEQ